MSRKTKIKAANKIQAAKLKRQIPIAPWITSITASLLPLSFAPWLYEQWHLPKVALTRIGFGLALGFWGWSIAAKAQKARIQSGAIFLAVFVLWALLATMLSPEKNISWWGLYGHNEGLLTYIVFAGVFIIAGQVLADEAWHQRTAIGVTAAAGVVAAYGLLQFLGLDFLNWGSIPFGTTRIFSTFGNPTYLATFMTAAFPLSLLMVTNFNDNKKLRPLAIAALALIGIGLALTFTRSAWLAAFCQLLMLGLLLRQTKVLRRQMLLPGAILAAAITVIMIISLSSGGEDITNRLKTTFDTSEGSVGSRIEIYKTATTIITENPLVGIGPDRFRFGFAVAKPETYVIEGLHPKTPDDAHNYLLNMAATMGIPAALLFLLFYGWVLVKGLRGQPEDGTGPPWRRVWLLSSIGAFISLMFTPSEAGGTFWVWFGLGLGGFVGSDGESTTETKLQTPLFRKSIAAVAIVLAGFLLVTSLLFMVADASYLKAVKLYSSAPDSALAAASQANRLYPYSDIYHIGKGRLALSRAIYLKDDKAFLQAAEAYQEGINIMPGNYSIRLELATAYLEAAKRLDPRYYQNMAVVLNDTIPLDPKDPKLWTLLAQASNGLGNKAEAAEFQAKAQKLSPDTGDQ